MKELPATPFVRIGDAARWLGESTVTLRHWQTAFAQWLRPFASRSGQRVYDRKDLAVLATIQHLLRVEMYTIAGARRQLKMSDELKRATA